MGLNLQKWQYRKGRALELRCLSKATGIRSGIGREESFGFLCPQELGQRKEAVVDTSTRVTNTKTHPKFASDPRCDSQPCTLADVLACQHRESADFRCPKDNTAGLPSGRLAAKGKPR